MAQVFGKFAGVYLKNGWTPVPVEMGSKRIAVDGFTGHDGEYPAARYVMDNWNAKYGAYNIGLRLGHDVIGIDVDAYGERNGAESLANLERELGELPYTYVSTSRSDGISGIRLFRVPRGNDANWRGKAAGGIDVISWHYRYVVCEPSIHPSTGNVYAWFLECHNGGGIEFIPCDVPAVADLPVLPEIWQEFLSSDFTGVKSEKLDTDVITDWLSMVGCGEPCEVISETASMWVSAVGDASDAGGIHDAVKDGIHSLLGDAVAGHAGALDELARLEQAFRNARDVRHDDRSGECDAEWRRLLYGEVRLRRGTESLCDDPCYDEYASASALKSMRPINSGTGLPYDRDEKEIARRARELRLNRAAQWRVQSESASEAPESQNGADFLEMNIPSPRVLVDDLLLLDGNTMLVAQRKAGKTTLVHNLVKSMCDDTDFLGAYPVNKPEGMKVALMDFEMQEGMLLEWLRDKIKLTKRGAASLELFRFRGKSSSFNIMSNSDREKWSKRLSDSGVEFLILDCLAPAMAANGLDENGTYEASTFLNALDEVTRMAGISGTLVVHHMGHAGERGRGASRLRDWPETEIHLIPEGQGADDNGHLRPRAKRFLAAEGRLGAFDERELSFDEGTHLLFVSGGSRAEAATEAALPAVMNYIQQTPGCTKTAVYTNAPGARRQAKEAALRELTEDGSVCVHIPPGKTSHNLYDNRECPDPSIHAMKINVK